MTANPEITILGAGAWGTTLAVLLAGKNYKVNIWEVSEKRCDVLNKKRAVEFPGIEPFSLKLSDGISLNSDLEKTVTGGADIIIFAIPSQFVQETARRFRNIKLDFKKCIFVSVVKGITEDMKRMTQLIEQEIPGLTGICALSGPNFAIEVAKGLPTATVVASANSKAAETIQKTLMADNFRIYTISDIAGVELGGALKNVIAIACGISDGMKLGDNAKASLITRGLREIIKLGVALGGKAETFMGLSGMGDLILTCSSRHSRNRALGEKIGSGLTPDKALHEIISTAEGYRSTKSAYLIGKKIGIELPIINETYSVIYEGKSPKEALSNLMKRQAKPEHPIKFSF